MGYRERIYKKYASQVQGQAAAPSKPELDRWSDPYDIYFKDWLPRDKEAGILDVACGYGRLLYFFASRGHKNVYGVDISPEQVEIAKQLHDNVACENAIEYLRKMEGQLGLITGIDIIEHLTLDEGLDLLDACYRALTPDGRLILQTPNMDSPFGLSIRYGDNTHEIGFCPKTLRQLLSLAGFEQFEAREVGPISRGLRGRVRKALWKIPRTAIASWNLIETGAPGSRICTRNFLGSAVKTS